ncbi:MAG: hypothetical protein HOP29_05520 [Phycisphaerales bacterium]|nr:hypothetical protein [Phycisphaerales bacterium]
MAGFTITRHIAAGPETVFERASDFHHAPQVIPAIVRVEMLTDGPVRVGTRFRETRMMFKREATETMEVLEFERPHRYLLGMESCGCRYRTEFRFTPNGQGTNVQMQFDGRPLTFFAKVMSVLMKPMMKSLAKMVEKDLDDLKAAIESGKARGA